MCRSPNLILQNSRDHLPAVRACLAFQTVLGVLGALMSLGVRAGQGFQCYQGYLRGQVLQEGLEHQAKT